MQTDVSENCEKPVNRTVLRIALYILLSELFDMSLVWNPSGFTWCYIGCNGQLNRGRFPVFLHNDFHSLCRKSKKSKDFYTVIIHLKLLLF